MRKISLITLLVLCFVSIFSISAMAAESWYEITDGVLTLRLDTWMEEYMPEEKPKLQSATVKVMGRYVVYCILSEDAKTDVFGAVDNLLLGK